MIRRPPRSPLFPSTPLSRSQIPARVPHRERAPVPLPDADPAERMRRAVREPIELGVGDATPLVQDERIRAARGDGMLERCQEPRHYASVPQSATSVVPVIIGTSSEARKAIVLAMSSGFDIWCGTGGE